MLYSCPLHTFAIEEGMFDHVAWAQDMLDLVAWEEGTPAVKKGSMSLSSVALPLDFLCAAYFLSRLSVIGVAATASLSMILPKK